MKQNNEIINALERKKIEISIEKYYLINRVVK